MKYEEGTAHLRGPALWNVHLVDIVLVSLGFGFLRHPADMAHRSQGHRVTRESTPAGMRA